MHFLKKNKIKKLKIYNLKINSLVTPTQFTFNTINYLYLFKYCNGSYQFYKKSIIEEDNNYVLLFEGKFKEPYDNFISLDTFIDLMKFHNIKLCIKTYADKEQCFWNLIFKTRYIFLNI